MKNIDQHCVRFDASIKQPNNHFFPNQKNRTYQFCILNGQILSIF